ncbi:S24/S26 family peptidase [Sphingobacterium sp. R2]|uniref:S24/S26 family peptidase n=1 Tax=Sphingobacterium sp. R2 TaxID=3112958 RepID=UPI00345DB64D
MQDQTGKSKPKIVSNADYFAEVQRMLQQGKEVRIRIKGQSMRPFIQDGDMVMLRAYKGLPLPLGSNILAKDKGKFVFHRLVGKKKDQYVLAGDGNLVLHEYITEKDIIAIAYMHYPKDKEAAIAIHQPWPRLRGLGWYHMRLMRRIIAKLKRMI